MAISIEKYVSITSGEGGGSAASERELILRLLSENELIPCRTVMEFMSAEDVSSLFGASNTEAKAASAYFGYMNAKMRRPGKISFYNSSLSAASAKIIPSKTEKTVSQFNAITSGSIVLNMDGTEYTASGINLSSAADLSGVASVLQSAIRALSSALLTGATVSFTDNRFKLTLGGIVDTLSVSSGTLASYLKWDADSQPVISPGQSAVSDVDTMLKNCLGISDNFGSLGFVLPQTSADGTHVPLAQFCHNRNLKFMALMGANADNVSTVRDDVKDYDGVGITAIRDGGDFAWLIPAAIMAATDYSSPGAAANYMYKQLAGITPLVSEDSVYETYRGKNINFYGKTMQAGAEISFYQHGVLQGSISDMGVYANEVWLKDAMRVALMNYQLSVNIWPANSAGEAAGRGLLMNVVSRGLDNGVVSAGKALTDNQKAYLVSATGTEDSWKSLQNDGYYLVTRIRPGNLGHEFVYELYYGKGDSIKRVDGYHIMI